MHGELPDVIPPTVFPTERQRPILVNDSTARAIRLGRVVCALPHLGTLIVIIVWETMPPAGASNTFVQPIKYINLMGGAVFYWWGIFMGGLCQVISLLIQAYGKLPENPKEGYLDVDDVPITSGHTDKIFSRDAILELTVFFWSIMFSNLLPVLLDTEATASFKAAFFGLTAFGMAIIIIMLTVCVRTLLNSWRDGLGHRDFQRWTLRTAREVVWICIFVTIFMPYASMVLQAQDLPLSYVYYTGTLFPPEGIGCPNENATTELINSFSCPTQPLCGMRTWQIACLRIQMAEAVRAAYVFSVVFPAHVFNMWLIIKMFSIGNVKRDDQEGDGDGATESKPLLRKRNQANRKQGASKISQVVSLIPSRAHYGSPTQCITQHLVVPPSDLVRSMPPSLLCRSRWPLRSVHRKPSKGSSPSPPSSLPTAKPESQPVSPDARLASSLLRVLPLQAAKKTR